MSVQKHFVVYYGAWRSYDLPTGFTPLNSGVTHINLSFANLENNFSITQTEGMFKYYGGGPSGEGEYWLEPAYLQWTNYKYLKKDAIKMMVAFGGATYTSMWSLLENSNNIPKIAQAFKQLLQKTYPVYQQKPDNTYHKIGSVSLDGIDLDFEIGDARPSKNQCENLALLIKEFKTLCPKNIISVTGYHVSADPLSCLNTPGSSCSYWGSNHCGELLPFFNKLKTDNIGKMLDFYNLMAYDAGTNYPYNIALENHKKASGGDFPIVLGVTIGTQWPGFVESMSTILKRVDYVKTNGYGGMMIWAIGAENPSDTLAAQFQKINQILARYQS